MIGCSACEVDIESNLTFVQLVATGFDIAKFLHTISELLPWLEGLLVSVLIRALLVRSVKCCI